MNLRTLAVSCLLSVPAFAAPGTTTSTAVPTDNPALHGTPVTAEDQSTRPSDVEVTRKIRVALMKEKLSMAAKNVTIITRDGKVILKGAVPGNEANRITGIARGVAGAQNVTSEITSPK